MSFSPKLAACAAAFLAFTAIPSSAAVIQDLGQISGTDTTPYSSTVGAGAFTDFITFSTASLTNTDISVSLTNTFTTTTQGKKQDIKGLLLSLYSGAYDSTKVNGGGTLLNSVPATHFTTSNYADLAFTLDYGGNYYFEISADKGSAAKAAYSGTISYSVETVPLPSSLPLLSGALLAMAAAGHVVSRRSAAKGAPAQG